MDHARTQGNDQRSGQATGRPRRSVPARTPAELPSGPLSPAAALDLQRLVGNETAAQLFAEHSAAVQRDAVHAALRSAGQPLDDGIRAEMEGRLSADFSDVRVHTDATAHHAAESVRAHAFTSGSHIVFQRGRYDPASPAGKRMLAHELTHVTQQRSGPVSGTDHGDGLRVSDPSDSFERAAEANAARAMSAPVQRATDEAPTPTTEGTTVQRDVGFEMEVSNASTAAFAPPLKGKERADPNQIAAITSAGWTKRRSRGARSRLRPQFDQPSLARRLTKGEELLAVPGLFSVQADDASGGGSDLEFVTTHFPESPEGRRRLSQAVDGMVRIASVLAGGYYSATELAGGATVNPVLNPPPELDTEYVVGGFGDSGSPQVTAGIPLERLESLYAVLHSAHAGLSSGDQATLAQSQDLMQQDQIPNIVGQARTRVNEVARLREQSGEPLSDRLRGLLGLVTTYLISGNARPNQPYYKAMAPILARTDFGAMFALLDPTEQAMLSGGNATPFVDLALECAGLPGTGDDPVLASVAAGRVSFSEVTRAAWLRGITEGTDLLSRSGYAASFPADAAKGEQFESMGSLGGQRDTSQGLPAPIVELRRMRKSLPLRDWKAVLLGVFDLIADIVAGGANPTYSRATPDSETASAVAPNA